MDGWMDNLVTKMYESKVHKYMNATRLNILLMSLTQYRFFLSYLLRNDQTNPVDL